MKFRFAIRIASSTKDITILDGPGIGMLANLLSALSGAITNEGGSVALSDVKDGSVIYEFKTNDKRSLSSFVEVNNRIQEYGDFELLEHEREFKKALKKLLDEAGIYYEAIGNEGERIAQIKSIEPTSGPTHYHRIKIAYGRIITFGAFSAAKPHQMGVELANGQKAKIVLSREQEESLSKSLSSIYKKVNLKLKLNTRISLIDGKEDYTLVGYEIMGLNSLFDGITEFRES